MLDLIEILLVSVENYIWFLKCFLILNLHESAIKQKDRNFRPAIDIFMQKKKTSGELHLVESS